MSTLVAIDAATAVMAVLGGAVYLVGLFLFVNADQDSSWRSSPTTSSSAPMVITASVLHFIAIWRVVATLWRIAGLPIAKHRLGWCQQFVGLTTHNARSAAVPSGGTAALSSDRRDVERQAERQPRRSTRRET